jgi:hypothetical protein
MSRRICNSSFGGIFEEEVLTEITEITEITENTEEREDRKEKRKISGGFSAVLY